MAGKRDFLLITVIGVAVGVLAQLIIANVLPGASPLIRIGVFLTMVLGAPAALFVAHLLSARAPVIYQFAKFAAVGALNVAIDFAVFNLLVIITGIVAGATASGFKAVSFLVATTNSFFWNKFWTFKAEGGISSTETISFYLVAGIGWVINVSLFSLVVNVLQTPAGMDPKLWANIGVVVGVLGSFLWNFLGYKFFVFKK